MDGAELLERIEARPEILGGKPIIRGTRLSVEYIMNLLAHGESADEIVTEYDGLTVDDIRACLLFAKRTLEDLSFAPLAVT